MIDVNDGEVFLLRRTSITQYENKSFCLKYVIKRDTDCELWERTSVLLKSALSMILTKCQSHETKYVHDTFTVYQILFFPPKILILHLEMMI